MGGGLVYTATVAAKGTSAGGFNGGVGFTIRLGEQGWKFYVESRYHYAFSPPYSRHPRSRHVRQ